MALARLALRNLKQKLSSPSSPSSCLLAQVNNVCERNVVGKKQGWSNEVSKRFMVMASEQEKQQGKNEVSVSEKKPSRLFPRRRGRRSLWRRSDDRDFVPALYEFFPSGLGNALLQATENINRLFDNLNFTPSQLMGRVKEQDDCYKLRYEVPGLSKDDVKITVDDGILTIKGEHKEEEGEGSPEDDEYWSSKSYGYYNTSVALPEDAKTEEIRAELKDGVLSVVIPRSEKVKKDVKEIRVN